MKVMKTNILTNGTALLMVFLAAWGLISFGYLTIQWLRTEKTESVVEPVKAEEAKDKTSWSTFRYEIDIQKKEVVKVHEFWHRFPRVETYKGKIRWVTDEEKLAEQRELVKNGGASGGTYTICVPWKNKDGSTDWESCIENELTIDAKETPVIIKFYEQHVPEWLKEEREKEGNHEDHQ